MASKPVALNRTVISWSNAELRKALEHAKARLLSIHEYVSATVSCAAAPNIVHRLAELHGAHYIYDPDLNTHILGLNVSGEMTVHGSGRFVVAVEQIRDFSQRIYTETPSALRWMGGFSFAQSASAVSSNAVAYQATDELWSAWPDGYFVLPKMLVELGPNGSHLTLTIAKSEPVDAALEWLTASLEMMMDDKDTPSALNSTHPCRDSGLVSWAETDLGTLSGDVENSNEQAHLTFVELVQKATDEITETDEMNGMEKVVVARAVHEHLNVPLRVTLQKLFDGYGDSCFVFSFSMNGQHFVGATPERLVRIEDGHVTVDCLAGTIGRGETAVDDQLLGKQLLHSDKNLREHAAVVRWVSEQIRPYVDHIEVALTPNLRKLRNVQHLFTPLTALIPKNTHILQMVEVLHPTPAVAGVPREWALHFLEENESLHRGWYAGPIGFINLEGEGAFAVALRSGLLSPQLASATLFAGVGIVRASDPEDEWQETELKLQPMRMAIAQERE